MTSANPSAAQQQPSAANAATPSQQATAVPAQQSRSYASAANKTAAPSQAGKLNNPKNSSSTMQNGEHGRKPSVIISASGTTGQIPNGGPATQSSRPNISFGSMNGPSGSPAIASSVPAQATTPNLSAANPRITSPSHSPSPIPQPAASGGKPPSNLPGQSNAPNFGSFGADNGDGRNAPLTPSSQPAHLRRESSQSQHSDAGMRGTNFVPGNGRGRGGFVPGYNAHSPAQNYRQLPNQQRGPPNMPPHAPQFQPQNPMGSPRFGRNQSPAMMHAQPFMPQGMQHQAQMHQGAYTPAHLNPQQQALYGMHPPYDAYQGYYQPYFNTPTGQYPQGAPPSPRPVNAPYPAPYGGPPAHMPQPYPTPMSRSGSQISERPGSSIGQPAAAAAAAPQATPAPGTPGPASSNFQIPQKTKSKAIVIKNDKGEEISFDKKPSPAPQSPAIVSSVPTPPPRTPSVQHNRAESKPAVSAAETKSAFQEQVKRQLEAQRAKEEAEKKAAQDKEEADAKAAQDEEEAAAKAQKDKEEAAAKAQKDKEESEARAAKEKEEAEAKAAKEKEEAEAKAAKEKEEAEAKAAKDKEEAEKAAAEEASAKEAADKAKADEDEAARLKREEDERIEREIAEMEEAERLEEERERAFQDKRAKEKEAAAKEAAAKLDEELKRQEREAEELELKKEKEREGETEKSAEEKAKDAELFASLKRPTLGPGASDAAETPAAPEPSPAEEAVKAAKAKPANLKLDTTKNIEPAQPTAGMQSLKSARFLEIKNDKFEYPEAFKSPNPALNQSGKRVGREYDMDFLLQFQTIFKEKPTVDWDQRIKETLGEGEGGSGRQGSSRGAMGGRQPSNRGPNQFGAMGSFGSGNTRTLPPGTSSADRFNASNVAARGGMPTPVGYGSVRGGFPVGGPGALSRTNSLQAMAGMGAPGSPKTGGSRRGGGGSRRGPSQRHQEKAEHEMAKSMPLTAGMDLKPLEKSSTGWAPRRIGQSAAAPATAEGQMPPDMVQRKVKAALNKMTPENFPKISDQIIEIANQSKKETDGRTLRQVIQLTFEKACDEAHWAGTYAKFCSKMLTSMSNEIVDETIRDRSGQPVVGGGLFRKYLLNRCQEEFERGWEANLPPMPEGKEAALLSDEYYQAAAAKRKGLGLIQFIGELYKLGMLTVKIMHQCVLRLLNFEGQPDEAAVENLSKLLKAVGATMDSTEQGHQLVNVYYDRVQSILDTHKDMPSRSRFMLMDIIDLRKNNWRSKDADKGPKTIEEIHAEAEAAHAAAELERQKNASVRGGRAQMGRGDARSFSGGGMPPPDYPRNQVGMDDLRRLQARGANRQASHGLGPSLGPGAGLFSSSRSGSGRKGLGPPRDGESSGPSSRSGTPSQQKKDEKESNTHVNAFSALAALEGEGAEGVGSTPSEAGSPPVSKATPSIDQAASSTDA